MAAFAAPRTAELAALGVATAAPLLIACLWVWALAGWRRLGRLAAGPAYRRAYLAVSLALAPCLALAALSAPALALDWLPPRVAGGVSALVLLAYVAEAGAVPGVWHNAAFRTVASTVALALAASVTALFPWPDAVPCAVALAICHRHQRRISALALRSHLDLQDLRIKVVALETRLRLPPEAGAAPERGLSKAG